VTLSLNAFREIGRTYETLEKMQRACEREITRDDGEFDLRPNSWETMVRLRDAEGRVSVKRASELLGEIADAEDIMLKRADPRNLLLSTLRLKSKTLELGLALQERLYHIQEIAAFQEDVIDAIEQADAPTADRIRQTLHARRTLRLALQTPRGDE
jgi:hypothetical protein